MILKNYYYFCGGLQSEFTKFLSKNNFLHIIDKNIHHIMIENILTYVEVSNISLIHKKSIRMLINEVDERIKNESIEDYYDQFKILFKKLNSQTKIMMLNDRVHRSLISQLIAKRGMQVYNYSYFNRAKLTNIHLQLLQQVGAYLFMEGVMIVSKMNVIYKNYSHLGFQNQYNDNQSIVSQKISQILKMCDQKKRTVNNNVRKLKYLFSDPENRIQLVRELGKLLRYCWKKEKKIKDIVKENKQQNLKVKQLQDKNYDLEMQEENIGEEQLRQNMFHSNNEICNYFGSNFQMEQQNKQEELLQIKSLNSNSYQHHNQADYSFLNDNHSNFDFLF